MPEIIRILGIGLIAILIQMTGIWVGSLLRRDSSIVDIFWGMGFVTLAWVYFALADGAMPRQLLVVTLVTLWGLRLSIHLLVRNWGKGEDFRYKKWREETGPSWWWVSYFRVFVLQGALAWLVALPLLAAQISPTPANLTLLDGLGVLLWAIGLFFETVGDIQLARFKADPANKGKVLDSGLWRYTRHPNYFGDATVWWGFGLIALATMTPFGVISLIGPALMTFLLVRVSGVALLEETLNEKPGYREYVERTSAFFPLPPKEGDQG